MGENHVFILVYSGWLELSGMEVHDKETFLSVLKYKGYDPEEQYWAYAHTIGGMISNLWDMTIEEFESTFTPQEIEFLKNGEYLKLFSTKIQTKFL